MLSFFKELCLYVKTISKVKRYFVFSILTFLIYAVFYFVFLWIFKDIFRVFWNDDILAKLINRLDSLKLLLFLKNIVADHLNTLFKPLILYFAYTVSFLVGPVLIGFLLDFLSSSKEKEIGVGFKKSSFLKSFAFSLKEELFMFSFVICWGTFVFILGLYYPGVSLWLFYLITPLIYGVYNLSYYFLKRGVAYSKIVHIGFLNFFSFYGLAWASSLVFFAVFWLLKFFSYSHVLFFSAFFLFALFKPISVLYAADRASFYEKNSFDKISLKKSFLSKIVHAISLILAIGIIITAVQFYSQLRSKSSFIECTYNLDSFELGSNSKSRGLGAFLTSALSPELKISLKVQNPSQKTITLEDFSVVLSRNGNEISKALLKGFVLKAGQEKKLLLRFKLDSIQAGKSIYKTLLQRGEQRFKLEALVGLKLWFGQVSLPVFKREKAFTRN